MAEEHDTEEKGVAENTVFSRCIMLRKVLLWSIGEVISYRWEGSDDTYRMNHIRDDVKRVREGILNDGGLDLARLTDAQCDELGFGRWEASNPLRLIPIWFYPFLLPGTRLASISGDETTVGENYTDHVADPNGYIDNDNRFGYLAYGIVPSEEAE